MKPTIIILTVLSISCYQRQLWLNPAINYAKFSGFYVDMDFDERYYNSDNPHYIVDGEQFTAPERAEKIPVILPEDARVHYLKRHLKQDKST